MVIPITKLLHQSWIKKTFIYLSIVYLFLLNLFNAKKDTIISQKSPSQTLDWALNKPLKLDEFIQNSLRKIP